MSEEILTATHDTAYWRERAETAEQQSAELRALATNAGQAHSHFARVASEQRTRAEQAEANAAALRVLAGQAIDAWSEEEEPTPHDISMSALGHALTEAHPGTALLAELAAARAVVVAAGAYRAAVRDLDGVAVAEAALFRALDAYDDAQRGAPA